jgi:hypothetical protein
MGDPSLRLKSGFDRDDSTLDCLEIQTGIITIWLTVVISNDIVIDRSNDVYDVDL